MHFDQNKSIGALGTLVSAKWYRAMNPRHLLISLDSAETRRWMNFDDDGRRADLLGLSVDDSNNPVIDILECKSGVVDATNVYSIDDNGRISGKPVEQLVNTGRSVGAIFGLNEWKNHILTPPRREILRNHLYRQGFTGPRTPQEKQYWEQLLNNLFSGEIKPQIRLNLILVNLGLNQESLDQVVEAEGAKMRLVHLNEESVSLHLGRRSADRPAVAEGPKAEEEAEAPPASEKPSVRTPSFMNAPLDVMEQINATCGRIRAACQDFGIKVTEIDPGQVDIGPSVLRFKIKLAPGEDSARLRKQAENIARQLAATSVPIIGFLPGTNYEYLDLARPDRQRVFLEPLLAETRLRDVNELPMHIGVDPSGRQTRLDLADDRLPHILVGGGTGSGKTIFLYSAVLSLVAAHTAKTLELVIIDPKQTDFTVFAGLPHLRKHEIITDARSGVDAVNAIAAHDMQQRSEQLQKAKYRDIKSYNLANPKNIIRPLVVVIDEYADLVSVLSKKERDDFERIISRITARGRNVGIHLILATQRPTADVVTGNIKANMACRISFSLPSSRDSQVILDEPGAERLLRNGDMLLLLEGKLTRLQGYYIDSLNIEKHVPRR